MEGFKKKERPDLIKRAIEEEDTALLKAAGRKGGISAQNERMRRKILKEEALEDARQHEVKLYGGHPPENDD